jgi:hypothetical protein
MFIVGTPYHVQIRLFLGCIQPMPGSGNIGFLSCDSDVS